jgi:hypothetical protein
MPENEKEKEKEKGMKERRQTKPTTISIRGEQTSETCYPALVGNLIVLTATC